MVNLKPTDVSVERKEKGYQVTFTCELSFFLTDDQVDELISRLQEGGVV